MENGADSGRRDLYPVPLDERGERPISPTDVSQFIRLDQCQRYLRLRLHERVAGRRFLYDYEVTPQRVQPLLTRSGAAFEAVVEAAVRGQYEVVDLAEGVDPARRGDDNARVIDHARHLASGATAMLFQPRLEVELGAWRLRGDADIVRMERDAAGTLFVVIADMKSSTTAKVEHRLQVAFYHEMLAALLARDGVEGEIQTAILYRGSAARGAATPEEAAQIVVQREAAKRLFNAPDALLELVEDSESYRASVRDLVTGPRSVAERVAGEPFEIIPYHLTYKCDGCLYNEFCMKWSAERDDLSLLPHLSERDKGALQRAGITRVAEVAHLKEPRGSGANGSVGDLTELVAAPGKAELVRGWGATWPVGPRLDELIHRARAYRVWKGDAVGHLSYIPSKGYGSLPYSDAGHNPNLVRVYVDAQHDYLNDRVYLLGSLVVASERGEEPEARRRSVVLLAEGLPSSAEAEARLFVRWIEETLRAIVDLAAADDEGQARAPIHLIFFDRYEQRLLLDGLGRHAGSIMGATPLYDFVTQLAAFDSPVATFLDQEIREMKNYPMVCQSLQAVAAYRRFDWNVGTRYREIFHRHLFDFWRKRDGGGEIGERPWYTGRARFSSQIPLEYAYAAWGELPAAPARGKDDYAAYRAATPDLLRGFEGRRLEAMEWIAKDFKGNKQTEKRSFDLPSLDRFDEKARGLAQALDEFVTIERHVYLNAWKSARQAPPERRVLSGQTLLARYEEAVQAPGVAETNRENERRRLLYEEQRAAFREANPTAKKVTRRKEERDASAWTQEGLRVRLRLDLDGVDADLDEVLGLTTLRADDRVVLYPRWTVDSRLPVAEQQLFQPTPKQMLNGTRASIVGFEVERDGAKRAVAGYVELALQQDRPGDRRGFAFPAKSRPLTPGAVYTIDEDPNNWYGARQAKVTEGLIAGGRNTLHERLAHPGPALVPWPSLAAEGQARFLAGLDALHEAGALHAFEESKRAFIGGHGADPMLLVQGPPGTGKSYSTAFAIFARLQGAIAAGIDFRVVLSCKTHAATDVLLENVLRVRTELGARKAARPALFAQYFDERLLGVPLFRVSPREHVPDGVIPLRKKEERAAGEPVIADAIAADRWCVVATTPGGVHTLVKERSPKDLFGLEMVDCLILDEASQMSLPEAVMAALPLKPDGRLIVVGDHRQMPPIVQHDWEGEPRRTFQEYRTYESLFSTLLPLGLPMIKFAESFRLHAEIAEFLRREVYHQDGIAYHSKRTGVLPAFPQGDAYVDAVLAPDYPLVVVVHDEAASQHRNPFERALVTPVLASLAAHGYDAAEGLGVVVPHRAQRAALQEAVPLLTTTDPVSGAVTASAVDTVERFQGGERTVILISATESDPAYLLASSKFLLDPRRLTVALSRAKQKMILVASRSLFELFSADEETFHNAQLWKNLLRRTCTTPLWMGTMGEVRVEVWGNAATLAPREIVGVTTTSARPAE